MTRTPKLTKRQREVLVILTELAERAASYGTGLKMQFNLRETSSLAVALKKVLETKP